MHTRTPAAGSAYLMLIGNTFVMLDLKCFTKSTS